MWNIFLKLSEMFSICSSADDVESLWTLFNQLKTPNLYDSDREYEDLYWSFYDRVCYLEDRYNDGRWA